MRGALPDVDPADAVDADPRRKDREQVLVLGPVADEVGRRGPDPLEDLVELVGDPPVGEHPDLRRAREHADLAVLARAAELVEQADRREDGVGVGILGVGDREPGRRVDRLRAPDDRAGDASLPAQIVVAVDADHEAHGPDRYAGRWA